MSRIRRVYGEEEKGNRSRKLNMAVLCAGVVARMMITEVLVCISGRDYREKRTKATDEMNHSTGQ